MLKVLEQYIEGESASTKRYATDRRFKKILAASVALHLMFYALIIQLDLIQRFDKAQSSRPQTDLVLVAEVGPPPKSPPLRTITEPLERVDTRKMEYDPETGNDTDLIARSPKLGHPEGTTRNSGSPKIAALKSPVGSGSSTNTSQKPLLVPPVTAPVVAQPMPDQTPTAPVASLRTPNQNIEAPPPVAPSGQSPQSQERLGTRAFSIDEVKSQYRALVRAKISKANERNMPRDWIRDILNKGVSAEFSIIVGRGGRLIDVKLIRSSGYPTLDSAAREAIYNARPFEGYPQDAGDEITFTVTVHYTPLP